MVDPFTRECMALVPQARFRGDDVVAVLQAAVAAGGKPAVITVENGTEFTSKALDAWAYWNGVQLAFSRPGKPVDNTLVEAFHGSLRRECLSQHWFISHAEAERLLTAWKEDYNNTRPHSSLQDEPPAHFRARALQPADLNSLAICES